MKINYGSIVTDGSGKLGGFVAARNRGGAYLRTKTSPSQPDTTYQETSRAQLAMISSMWSGLTNAQRASWNNGVKDYKSTDIFGDIKSPSGLNLFIKLNITRWRMSYFLLLVCPRKYPVKYQKVSYVEFITVAPEESFCGFDDEFMIGSIFLLRATPPVGAGVTYITNKLRDIIYVELDGNQFSYGEEYVARFGNLSPGDIFWVTVTVIGLNGLHGVSQKIRVIAQ